MDDETIGKALGYVEWSTHAAAIRQGYNQDKQQLVSDINKNSGYEQNKYLLQQVQRIIGRKQSQTLSLKLHVYEELQNILEDIMPIFEDMHAELFVSEIHAGTIALHNNTAVLHETIKRQEQLLAAMNFQTFDDLIDSVLFLYQKEQQLNANMQKHAIIIHKNATKLVQHMDKNYFERLSRISNTEEFFNNHKDILHATYLVSVCSRALARIHGLDTRTLTEKENGFRKSVERRK